MWAGLEILVKGSFVRSLLSVRRREGGREDLVRLPAGLLVAATLAFFAL